MKKIILTTLIGLATLTSCTSNVAQKNEERRANFAEMIDVPTTIELNEMNFDFGTITDGDLVSHVFTFKNTGDKDLILIAVKASCGCTVLDDWPKHPLAPGDSGEIKVTFNSADKLGNIRKTIRIEANTSPTLTTLAITGVVEPVK